MKYTNVILAALLYIVSSSLWSSGTTISGIHGTWWNPDYDGEGFVLEQYNDGLVIGYWYTYDQQGNQLWLIGTGQLVDDHVDLEMTITEGGLLGSLQNPDIVQRDLWGILSLDLLTCDKIDMSYEGVDGSLGSYQIERLINGGLSATSCINTGAPKVVLQEYDFLWGWKTRAIPMSGVATMQKTIIGGGSRISHYEFRLVAEEGDIKIKSLSASDSSGITEPTIEGLVEEMTILEGEAVAFSLDSGFTDGQTVKLDYYVELYGLGTLIDLEINLTTN